jgi:hypothetical protein
MPSRKTRFFFVSALRREIAPITDRLSPIEAVMWRMGQDPGLRMTIRDLLTLDRLPARSDSVERLGLTSEYAERLRQRPVNPTYARRSPHWATDSDFDPARHVRTIDCLNTAFSSFVAVSQTAPAAANASSRGHQRVRRPSEVPQ